MERREFLKWSAGASALAFMQLAGIGCTKTEPPRPAITLPPLPYEKNALEPYLSVKTMDLHYGKHHQGYVQKVNALVPGTCCQGKGLGEIILESVDKPELNALFNNAAQVFNHTFYWKSMKPQGGGRPEGVLGGLLDDSFGSYEAFSDGFIKAATSQFGSGWIWLVKGKQGLKIVKTSNANTPITRGLIPVITLDVWEHAYYLDYQNRRADYAKAFLNNLVDWRFAEKNLG